MEATEATSQVSQARLILNQQVRAQRAFSTQVVVWWGFFLLLLIFIFSGIRIEADARGVRIEIGAQNPDEPTPALVIQTIQLDQEFIQQWARFISEGVPKTLEICVESIIFASLLALLAALGRLSRLPPVYALSTFYVSLIRGTPLYLQIFFFFLALPQLGIVLPGPVAGVVALSLNYGAYMSEIFRAGIQSVGKGQREAALALGMTNGQMMRRIVLPQALRLVVPPTGNEFIAMLKDSSLVAATGFVQEVMWRATKVGRANFRGLEALLVAALWYWAMTLIFSWLQSRLEKRMSRGER